MYNKAYIYNKNLEVIAIPYILGKGEFKENPAKFYPSWNRNEMYYSLVEIEQPILDNGVLREKTREELILLDNKLELLQDGEYVKAGEIIVVEAPENLVKKTWDKNTHIWKEGATREELIEERKNKILKYSQLKKEKDELIASGFAIQEEIDSIDIQMKQYKKDIDELEIKIKGL
ncbi:MAG: hypothetical protein HUJ87_00780 [Fusobacterium varium]|uniref:hypothetical protein n=1 Tax=Fusobacterium varium TaxID=856 RepID=UPI0024312885|nr:hypothetical protein [Fusobacterium varium]MCF0169006.1 hypothetical protein [Fusobacterium varium]